MPREKGVFESEDESKTAETEGVLEVASASAPATFKEPSSGAESEVAVAVVPKEKAGVEKALASEAEEEDDDDNADE